jgi:acetate kinase
VLLREQVCRDLAYLGLEIDPRANQNVTPGVSCAIQTANSAIDIWVVPTDEEQVAARDALQILRTGACVTIAPTAH